MRNAFFFALKKLPRFFIEQLEILYEPLAVDGGSACA